MGLKCWLPIASLLIIPDVSVGDLERLVCRSREPGPVHVIGLETEEKVHDRNARTSARLKHWASQEACNSGHATIMENQKGSRLSLTSWLLICTVSASDLLIVKW